MIQVFVQRLKMAQRQINKGGDKKRNSLFYSSKHIHQVLRKCHLYIQVAFLTWQQNGFLDVGYATLYHGG